MPLVGPGVQYQALATTTAGAGSRSATVSLQASAVLVSVWVPSLTSGAVTVQVREWLGEGITRVIHTFAAISAPTAEPVVWESDAVNQTLQITATYTGACRVEIYVRPVSRGAAAGGGGSSYFPSGW